MRNLKKFLAVLVVVAMMATTMMTAFGAADAALTPAEKAAGLGLLKGGANGVDDTYLNLTTQRIQTAYIYLRLIGKEAEAIAYDATTENFADVAQVASVPEAVKVMAYLRANPQLGWVGDGTNFNPLGEVSGQALYKVMLTAVGYTQGLDFDFADTIGFARAKGFSLAAYVGYADSVTNNGMAAAMIEALGTNMNGKTTTLAQKLVADKVISEADASKYTSYVIPAVPTATPVGAFAITSVTSDNLKSAVVKFNQPIDATAGALAANYTVNDATPANVALAADRMSAVVTLATAIAQSGTIKVVLAAAAISATATTTATLTSAAITDTTMPTVKSVTVTGNKLLVITYSEPVQGVTAGSGAGYLGNFTIDGAVYSALAPAVSADQLTTTLTLTQRMAAGAHKIVVNTAVLDFASIPVAPNSNSVTVATDAVAPTKATLNGTASQTTVVVNFDKGIDSIGTVYAGSLAGTYAVDGTDKTKVTLTFATPFLPAATSVITFTNVTDLSGNVAATISLSVTPVIDVARPAFVSVTQKSSTTFEVLFSKPVVTASGTYTLKDKNGVVMPVAKSTAALLTGETTANLAKVLITTNAAIDDTTVGPWSLLISGVTDTTPLANILVDYTAPLTFVDMTLPTLTSIKYNAAVAGVQTIYAKFSEKVDAATATAAANYSLIINNIARALPSNSTLALQTDGMTVLITIPLQSPVITTAVPAAAVTDIQFVSVSGVKDLALNVIGATSQAPALNAEAAPSFTTAKVTGANTVVIPLAAGTSVNPSTLVPYDFQVVSGNATSVSLSVIGATVALNATTGLNEITLTTNTAIAANGKYLATDATRVKVYTVLAASMNTKNIYGTALLPVAAPVANVGGILADDVFAPSADATIIAAYSMDNTKTQFRVKISENISGVVTAGELAVTLNGYTVPLVGTVEYATAATSISGSPEMIITVNTGIVDAKTQAYLIRFAPVAASTVIDASGNALKAFTLSGTVAD